MVSNDQVRRLKKMLSRGKNLKVSALASGMDVKTARKYRDSDKLPSELQKEHNWRTREDPFADDWLKVKSLLENNPGLEATTIFKWLQRENSGKYQDGQLRTLQRRIKHWRATEGPPKEVYFPQVHYPGALCQSDFTHMDKLGITINGRFFKHMLFHFVLTYSNWETGFICYSESFESLSTGLQKALWQLGGVPRKHQTDRFSAAVNNLSDKSQFTKPYQNLLDYYGIKGQKIEPAKPNQNGDVEQSHYRFKKAVEQALMLRGSRDFTSLKIYRQFLEKIFQQLNAGRAARFKEEIKHLKPLPKRKLAAVKKYPDIRVRPSSTIRINKYVYSVHSRLIGEKVTALLYSNRIKIKYGGQTVDILPRISGKQTAHIDYRHLIDSLIRKPGAFKNYRYQKHLFPNTHFRLAYDLLQEELPERCDKEYLKILHTAAYESEAKVTKALAKIIDSNLPLSVELVKQYIAKDASLLKIEDIPVASLELSDYDKLLHSGEVTNE